jgi:hypothetical protein
MNSCTIRALLDVDVSNRLDGGCGESLAKEETGPLLYEEQVCTPFSIN